MIKIATIVNIEDIIFGKLYLLNREYPVSVYISKEFEHIVYENLGSEPFVIISRAFLKESKFPIFQILTKNGERYFGMWHGGLNKDIFYQIEE